MPHKSQRVRSDCIVGCHYVPLYALESLRSRLLRFRVFPHPRRRQPAWQTVFTTALEENGLITVRDIHKASRRENKDGTGFHVTLRFSHVRASDRTNAPTEKTLILLCFWQRMWFQRAVWCFSPNPSSRPRSNTAAGNQR